MHLFVLIIASAIIMVALGIKHDEPTLIGVGFLIAVFISFAYGKYTEAKKAIMFVKHMMEEKDDK